MGKDLGSILRDAAGVLGEEGLASILRKAVFLGGLRVGDTLVGRVSALKHDGRVVFGTRHGRGYEGNARAVFEHLLETDSEVDPVWLTGDDAVIERLRSENRPVRSVESLRGLVALLRAEVAFVTHSARDVTLVDRYVDSVTWIYAGHGTPVKWGGTKKSRARQEHKYLSFDHYAVESAFAFDILDSHLDVDLPADRATVTGYARNDALLSPDREARERWNAFLGDRDPDLVALYAPTQRSPARNDAADTVDLFPFDDFDRDRLFDLLESENALLLVKLHPADYRRMDDDEFDYGTRHPDDDLGAFLDDLSSHEAVECVDGAHELSDPSEILPFIDLLVTDYSSIYHDFLLLDRPMVFLPYDAAAFERDYGFAYDYDEHGPGVSAATFDEFVRLLRAVGDGEDPGAGARKQFLDLFHEHTDDRSCERTAALIRSSLSVTDQ